MRGEILQYDNGTGEGLISGDDGQRYSFTLRQLLRPATLHAGLGVDFVPAEGLATEIVVLERAIPPRVQRVRQGSAEHGPWGYFMKCLSLYADGHGRARRSEYWWFTLFQILLIYAPILFGLVFIGAGQEAYSDALIVFGFLLVIAGSVIALGVILPSVCVLIRRLHDVGLSGWLILLGLVPYLGGLVLFVITLLPSQGHKNEHGPVPGATVQDTANLFS